MPIEKYGLRFPDGTLPETIELFAYRQGRTVSQGGLGKFGHLKSAIDLIWNSGKSSREFIWSPAAEEILRAYCEEDYVAVAGSASSGKSDASAVWALCEFFSGPADTLVLVTSTTLREARRRIFKSISELYFALPKGKFPGKMVDSLGQLKGLDAQGNFSAATGIVLVPAEKKKEREAIGKLAGIKQTRVRLVADELPELSEAVVTTAYSNLSSNPDFKMVGLGNPASHFDAFGVFAKPKAGWDSVNEEDFSWETSRGVCIRLDGTKSENYIQRKQIYPWMYSYEKIEQLREDYGEDSAFFYRMVRGFWAPEGSANGIYSESDLVKGSVTRKAKFDSEPSAVAALDPAFTHGGDRSILYFGWLGNEAGVRVLELDGYVSIKEDINNTAIPRTHQVAREVKRECLNRGVLPQNMAVDETGAGGPFADVLAMEWSDRFLRVNFAGKASSMRVSASDRTKGYDRYANRVSELWFAGKELLRSSQLRNVQDDLAKEMVAREFSTLSGGKVKVESKIDYKARMGRSPDLADAAFILTDLCRQRHGLVGGERFEASQDRQATWNLKMKKLDLLSNSDRTLLKP